MNTFVTAKLSTDGQPIEMPAQELAPGMVATTTPDDPRVIFVEKSMLRPAAQNHSNRLPEGFEVIATEVFKDLRRHLHWVKSEAEWVDGFRTDAHPVRELTLWMSLCVSLHSITHEGRDHPAIAAEVFGILVQAMTNGKHAIHTIKLKRISKARAQTAIRDYLAVDPQRFAEFWADRIDVERFVTIRNEEEAN